MKRVVIFLLSLLIAVYLVFVFMTIKSPEGSDTMCKGVKIEIAQDENEGFLTVSEVRKMLTVDHLNPAGLMMDEVNTRLIEDKLKAKELIDGSQGGRAHPLSGSANRSQEEIGAFVEVLLLWSERSRVEQIFSHQRRIRQSDYMQKENIKILVKYARIKRIYRSN